MANSPLTAGAQFRLRRGYNPALPRVHPAAPRAAALAPGKSVPNIIAATDYLRLLRAGSRPSARDDLSTDLGVRRPASGGSQPFMPVDEAAKVARERLGLSGVKRRDLIALLGGTAVGWPLAVCAQRGGIPVVGFLHYASTNELTHLADAFRRGLLEVGYIEGQNVVIEYRWAEGQYDRLPALAADLVRRQVGVIAAGGSAAAQAAKNATTTIPIVFTSGADPVATGLVTSLRRPGGNISGMSLLAAELAAKRLELIRDLLPRARAIAMITNPDFPGSHSEMAEVEAAGRLIGMRTHKAIASSPSDLDSAFAIISQLSVDAFTVGADGFFITRREQFAALAAHYALPGIYPFPDFPEAGGLISYGLDLGDAYRQVGVYAGRILKGANPADLPVMQPTKFQLVINMKTVKTLGLTVPQSLLARADEVIE